MIDVPADSSITDYFEELFSDGEYDKIIDEITGLLDENPNYINENYLSFPNSLEKAIYEEYFDSLDNHIVFNEFRLDELFLIYARSFINKDNLDDAEKYLKIANRINPVSTPVLIWLSNLYIKKGEFEKVRKISEDVFKFNYYIDILFSNYRNYAICLGDPKLISQIFNFNLFIKSKGNEERLEKTLIYLNDAGIQIGFNPKILEISEKLYYESNLNAFSDEEFLEDIYRGLYGFNSYYKGLSLDINLDVIIEDVKISIANNEVDGAITKIKDFLQEDSIDTSRNYKIFNNEIEREFYYKSPDFDCNFILLPKHKNYYYLYYLYAFCFKKQEKYEEAIKPYLKALEYNPYCIFVNRELLEIKLDHKMPVDVDELNYLADICYTRDDLIKVYGLFSRYFETKGKREEYELIDTFATHLYIRSYRDINLKAVKLLKDNNFSLGFNQNVISCLEKIIKLYNENDIKNLNLYKKYLDDCLDLNEQLSIFDDLNVDLDETGLIKDFDDEDLIGSFVLIKDKFSQKYYSNADSFRLDFADGEFDSSDSFICYCYRQVTGSIFFLVLSLSSDDEELVIYDRQYFGRDIIISKELLENEDSAILNNLTQFDNYIDTSDDYYKWIGRNISGNEEIDKEFLLNELRNVNDDPFNYKKDCIGNELKKIIKAEDLLKKEVPCDECIGHVEGLINNGDYKAAWVYIDDFLKEYPPLYFDGYMSKYVYFDELEREIYFEYAQPSGRLINLPASQNYCEIFNLKAKILLFMDKCDEAIDYVEYSLKFNPLNVKSKVILSDIFFKKEDYEYSKQLLKESLVFNRNLAQHIEIYEKLTIVCEKLNENKLADGISKLIFMLNELTFDNDAVLEIKNDIVNDGIFFGFNQDMILDDEELLKINEELNNSTSIDNILQQTKPLIEEWPRYASEKLGRYISENSQVCGYNIPYNKFDASLMYGDETDGDEYYNFENEIDYEIFKRLNPDCDVINLIPGEYRVCELLNTYAYSNKYFLAGKSAEILKESLKLNPVNQNTLLTQIDMLIKLSDVSGSWLDKAKEAFDGFFKVCHDKNILIEAYEHLSKYYRYRGLRDVSDDLDRFVENIKNDSLENKNHIDLFEKLNIPLGFNEEIMEIVKNVDRDVYDEMCEFNDYCF
ncbi:tetratricopeptide repeat protein [Methanobrevibacter sp.]|uniref:tetratricopeptide repeat protein n=1 Tax=Methanobrevibacter sp. TaxID=66852 RepID=UPI003891092E